LFLYKEYNLAKLLGVSFLGGCIGCCITLFVYVLVQQGCSSFWKNILKKRIHIDMVIYGIGISFLTCVAYGTICFSQFFVILLGPFAFFFLGRGYPRTCSELISFLDSEGFSLPETKEKMAITRSDWLVWFCTSSVVSVIIVTWDLNVGA
jgi:hypothetical protein